MQTRWQCSPGWTTAPEALSSPAIWTFSTNQFTRGFYPGLTPPVVHPVEYTTWSSLLMGEQNTPLLATVYHSVCLATDPLSVQLACDLHQITNFANKTPNSQSIVAQSVRGSMSSEVCTFKFNVPRHTSVFRLHLH